MPLHHRLTHRWAGLILAEMTLANLGFYAVLALLTLHLVEVLHFPAPTAAGLMILYSVGLRFMRLVLSPFINRFSPHRTLLLALAGLGTGYAGLGIAHTPFTVGFLLLLIGTAYGANGLLVTTLLSHATKGSTHFRYAILNTCTNIAAALGPVAANLLKLHVSPSAPFFFAALMVSITFVMTWIMLPRELPHAPDSRSWKCTVISLLKNPGMRLGMGLTILAWMLYQQKFASLPLFVHNSLQRPDLVGTFFALNAAVVILFSLLLSRLFHRLGLPTAHALLLSYGLYGFGFFLVWLSPTVTVTYIAVLFWAVGEAIVFPAMNTAIAEATAPSERMTGFALNAIAIGVGEGIGNTIGILSMENASQHGEAGHTYGFYTLLSLGCIAIAYTFHKINRIRATAHLSVNAPADMAQGSYK